jgi:hypothetical protein
VWNVHAGLNPGGSAQCSQRTQPAISSSTSHVTFLCPQELNTKSLPRMAVFWPLSPRRTTNCTASRVVDWCKDVTLATAISLESCEPACGKPLHARSHCAPNSPQGQCPGTRSRLVESPSLSLWTSAACSWHCRPAQSEAAKSAAKDPDAQHDMHSSVVLDLACSSLAPTITNSNLLMASTTCTDAQCVTAQWTVLQWRPGHHPCPHV